MRSRNSDDGMMGCAARDSTTMNRAPAATAAAISPRICGESQAKVPLPQVQTRTTALVSAAISAVPRWSIPGPAPSVSQPPSKLGEWHLAT